MKKLLTSAFISLLLIGSLFAQEKRYIIDLYDTTNGKEVTIKKNPYGNNFQNANPPTFTKYFAGNLPVPGDTIEVHFKFKSAVDIPALTMAVIDNSPLAKYWLAISNQYESVLDIKAGIPFEGVLVYKVNAKAISAITVQMMYNDEINNKITLLKSGARTSVK